MYTKLSELVRISPFLQSWNGNQTSKIKTANSKVQQFHQSFKDSLINVTLLKLLEDYDFYAYQKALQTGVSFIYQLGTFNLKSQNKDILCEVIGRNGQVSCNIRVTRDSILFDNEPGNADYYLIIFKMFRENKNENLIRKANR